MGKIKVRGKDTVFTLYGTRVDKDGETLFLIYVDGCWHWEDAEIFIPVD